MVRKSFDFGRFLARDSFLKYMESFDEYYSKDNKDLPNPDPNVSKHEYKAIKKHF